MKLYHSIKHLRQATSPLWIKIFPQLSFFILALSCLLITSGVSAQSITPRGAAISGVSNEGLGLSLSLSADGNTMAIGTNDDDVAANNPRSSVKVKIWNGTAWVQKGSTLYGEQDGNNFGFSLSLSADGTTLAVGAHTHSDIALYGAFSFSGRAYVYDWNGTDWVLRSTALIGDAAQENFGNSVSLSEDGNVLAVGAPGASAGGTLRGVARVFTWNGSTWVKQGSDIEGGTDFENLGTSVSVKVTATESVLAVGAPTFTPAPGSDNTGLVKIYRDSEGSWGGTWSSPEILNGSNTGDYFGYSVSLSNDGNRLAVGSPTDGLFSAAFIGYARVFDYAAGSFTQSGVDIISNLEYDTFGERLALSGDGQRLIIGAKGGVGNENGRAEVYAFNASNWQQVGSDLPGEAENDYFGQAVAINQTGTVVAIGASVNANGGPSSGQVRAFNVACAPPAAPSGIATQVFCGGATVAQLTATGTGIQWYDAPSGGTLLNGATTLTNNTIYYASQTVSDCESTDRLAVTVELLPLPAQPVSEVTHPTCALATGTITITTQQIGETYSFDNGLNFQAGNTASGLVAGDYQILIKNTDGCLSPVATAIINPQPLTPVTPETTVTQPSCAVTSGTVTVTAQQAGETYSFNNGTDFQENNIKSGLTTGDYQVIIKSAAGCTSVATLATVNAAPAIPDAPTGNAAQSFCSSATVAQLTATGTSIKWYAAESGGIALNTTTPLTTNTTYYASQTVACESTARLAVAVTITVLTAPTGDAVQNFCEEGTLAELTATAPETISWYTTPTGGTPLAGTVVLTKGTYYAGYIQNGCESPRLAVAVDYAFFWNTMAAGASHALAIQRDGTLWAWGNNSRGQLGIGNTTNQQKPVKVGTDRWTAVATGNEFSAGLKQDGTLWTWGRNDLGQLGNGTQTSSSVPTQVGTNKWLSVAATYDHVLALREDGTLWTWGGNIWGQLTSAGGSMGEGTFKSLPLQIGTDNNWVFISAGWGTGAGIKQDGTLWTWGGNEFGQLGRGNILGPGDGDPLVGQVGTDKWKTIHMGVNASIGIKENNTLWISGFNNTGMLGNGTTTSSSRHVQVGTDLWLSASVSGLATAGIKQDGTLWTWGDNRVSQLGNGTTESTTTPGQVGTSNKWRLVSSWGHNGVSGSEVVLGLQQDGTLWSWGSSNSGELGTNTTTNNTPTRVGAAPPVLAQPAINVDFANAGQPVLTTSGGSEYVWYKNGSLIAGANEATYNVAAEGGEGTYTVAVVGAGGCQSPLSNEIPIYITALDFEPEASIQLYPNPAQESLLVKVAEQAQFSVVSMNGHVQRISTEWLSNEQAHRVHIKDLISGMYILQIQQNGKRAQVKFIRQ